MSGDVKAASAAGSRKSENTGGMLLALTAFLTFSTSDLCSKFLGGKLNPYEVAFSGGVFGILLIPFLWKRGYTWRSFFPETKAAWILWVLRAFCVFAATACAVTAFMLLPMAEAMALMFLMPLVTNIMTVTILRERVPASSWIVALVGFAGILIVEHQALNTLTLGVGEICAIAVSVTSGANIMAARGLSGKASDLGIYTAVLVGPILGDGIFFGKDFIMPQDWSVWMYIFGYGFLAALAQLFLIYASQKIIAAKISLAQYSQLIWSTVFGLVLFHEVPDIYGWIGLSVVLFSGVLGAIFQKREEKANELALESEMI